MAIIRGQIDFSAHFTQVPNEWVRDANLSHRARGVLLVLMSHRSGWEVTTEHLIRNGTEGRDAIRKAIRELVGQGYLQREQVRGEDSARASGSRYVLTGKPLSDGFSGAQKSEGGSGFSGAQKSATKNTNRKNTKKNTNAPADADAAFEVFWDSYPAERKGGKRGEKGAFSRYKALAAKYGTDGLMDRLQHYKRTRARLERAGEFVSAVPHVTTWLNQHRWDDFGAYKPGPVELTADEVNQILGPDHWAPESPDGGFQTVEEELEWRQAAYAARLEERKQRAKEVMTGGTVRQDS